MDISEMKQDDVPVSFMEFKGKKDYECRNCGASIKYASFTNADGQIITSDGKPPNGEYGKDSNVKGFRVDPNTKNIHKCGSGSRKPFLEPASGTNPNVTLDEITTKALERHDKMLDGIETFVRKTHPDWRDVRIGLRVKLITELLFKEDSGSSD